MREHLKPRTAQDTAHRSDPPSITNIHPPLRGEYLVDAPPRDPRVEVYLDRIFDPLAGLIPHPRWVELRAELALHLEALTEAHRELGSEPEEALRAAMEQLGDPRHLRRDFAAEWRSPAGSTFTAAVIVPCALVFLAAAFFGASGLTLALRQVAEIGESPWGDQGYL